MDEIPMNLGDDAGWLEREIRGWSSMSREEIEEWIESGHSRADRPELDEDLDDDLDLDDGDTDDEPRDPEDDPDAYGGREWLDLPDYGGYTSDDMIRGWFGEHPNDFNGEY